MTECDCDCVKRVIVDWVVIILVDSNTVTSWLWGYFFLYMLHWSIRLCSATKWWMKYTKSICCILKIKHFHIIIAHRPTVNWWFYLYFSLWHTHMHSCILTPPSLPTHWQRLLLALLLLLYHPHRDQSSPPQRVKPGLIRTVSLPSRSYTWSLLCQW